MKPLRLLRSITLPLIRRDVSQRNLTTDTKRRDDGIFFKKTSYETDHIDDDCSIASASTLKAGTRPVEERQNLKRLSSIRKRNLRAMTCVMDNNNNHVPFLSPVTAAPTDDVDVSHPIQARRTLWKSMRNIRSEKILSRAALELANEELRCETMRSNRNRTNQISLPMKRFLADSWNNDRRAEF
jgi:hypothetical protein